MIERAYMKYEKENAVNSFRFETVTILHYILLLNR